VTVMSAHSTTVIRRQVIVSAHDRRTDLRTNLHEGLLQNGMKLGITRRGVSEYYTCSVGRASA